MKLKLSAANPKTHKRLQAVLQALVPDNPKSGTFCHAHSSEGSPTEIRHVVTTGIRVFDDRVGGMPFGKATELVGLPQSGKTTMAIRTAVRAQQGFVYQREQTPDGSIKLTQLKLGTFEVTVLYFDQEGSLSDFDKRIVDGTLLDAEIIQADTVELLWSIMDSTVETLVEIEKETGKLQFLIVVIDTVGTLATKTEYLTAWGKQDYPRVPAELKNGFKVMIGRMQRDNVMLIGLNHVSRRMEVRGRVAHRAWEYNAPGGKAFGYFAFHRVFFEMKEVKYTLVGKRQQDGFLVDFSALKNRLAPPLRPGRLSLLFTIKDVKTGKLKREGGFYDSYSTLECLLLAKAATLSKETGTIAFDFDAFGVQPVTFNAQAAVPELEEQEEVENEAPRRGRKSKPAEEEEIKPRKSKPKIPNRAAWPAYYSQHQADFDALHEAVKERVMSASDLQTPGVAEEGLEDES